MDRKKNHTHTQQDAGEKQKIIRKGQKKKQKNNYYYKS